MEMTKEALYLQALREDRLKTAQMMEEGLINGWEAIERNKARTEVIYKEYFGKEK